MSTCVADNPARVLTFVNYYKAHAALLTVVLATMAGNAFNHLHLSQLAISQKRVAIEDLKRDRQTPRDPSVLVAVRDCMYLVIFDASRTATSGTTASESVARTKTVETLSY